MHNAHEPHWRLYCAVSQCVRGRDARGAGGVVSAQAQFGCGVEAFGNATMMLDHCGDSVTARERFYAQDVCGAFFCIGDCNDCPGGVNLLSNTPVPPDIANNAWTSVGTI